MVGVDGVAGSGLYPIMHAIIFFLSVVTPIVIFVTYSRFGRKSGLRRIALMLMLSFVFGGLRWSGGSIEAMQIGYFIGNPLFMPIWTLSGVLAAAFGVYAALLLYEYSKMFGFEKFRAMPAIKPVKRRKRSGQ